LVHSEFAPAGQSALAEKSRGRIGEADLPIPETVAALLDAARDEYAYERARSDALEARLGQLIGFVGLLLALIPPLGANQLGQRHDAVFSGLYIASIVVLAGTAVLAVTREFRRRTVQIGGSSQTIRGWRRTGIGAAQLVELSGSRTAAETVQAQRQLIADLVADTLDQRGLNGLKYGLIRRVSAGLCVGLLAIASQAVALAL
jgi:hypothetical protein